jgi:hypothetical protein
MDTRHRRYDRIALGHKLHAKMLIISKLQTSSNPIKCMVFIDDTWLGYPFDLAGMDSAS